MQVGLRQWTLPDPQTQQNSTRPAPVQITTGTQQDLNLNKTIK